MFLVYRFYQKWKHNTNVLKIGKDTLLSNTQSISMTA